MGISGLHAQLKSAQAPIEAEELRGKTLCVDGHALLHRGALSCCEDLAEGVTTTKYADYVVFRAKMLSKWPWSKCALYRRSIPQHATAWVQDPPLELMRCRW